MSTIVPTRGTSYRRVRDDFLALHAWESAHEIDAVVHVRVHRLHRETPSLKEAVLVSHTSERKLIGSDLHRLSRNDPHAAFRLLKLLQIRHLVRAKVRVTQNRALPARRLELRRVLVVEGNSA